MIIVIIVVVFAVAVSAFYAECPSKRIFMNATVETRTRFQGLSVKIQNSGVCKLIEQTSF